MTDPDVEEITGSALLAFLHRAPIAVMQMAQMAQMAANGDVETFTPVAAQLPRPLSREGQVGNLFALLERWSPGLRQTLRGLAAATGRVFDGRASTFLPSLPNSVITARGCWA